MTLLSACATIHTVHRLSQGEWFAVSQSKQTEWINGAPTHTIEVEARLTTPPRALCHQRIDQPPAINHFDEVVFTDGVRVATILSGIVEMTGGILSMVTADDGELGPGGIVALSMVAADGLAALIMAAAIPKKPVHRSEVLLGRTSETDLCPTGLAFELGLERFPVMPNGEVLPEAATHIMREVVETGMPIGLRHGDDLQMTTVPPDVRCAWALHLNHTAQRALCPQRPEVVRVPVPVPVLLPVPRPQRR